MSADEGARRAIAERLDATMLVEAGAGTGKTRALVDRVVALVAAGTRIERIAAITFTERAAAELRERVRTGLDERLADPATAPAVRDRCEVARDDLERAQLSTIHAFGQALLRSMCAEAGIDPEITVLDQLTAERRFEERWRAALERVDPAGDDGVAIDRALGLGLRIKDLRRLGEALTERADIAERILAEPPVAPAPDWSAAGRLASPSSWRSAWTACRATTAACCTSSTLMGVLDALMACGGWERDERAPYGDGDVREEAGERRTGRELGWRGSDRRPRGGAPAVVGTAILRLLDDARAEATAAVLPWVARTVLEDAARRRREGTLIFTDLILWTRDLLRDDPSARAMAAASATTRS